MTDTPLVIAGKTYNSRLLVGSGKYKDLNETKLATDAAEADIITVAIRRTNIGQDENEPNLLDVISPEKYTILPNTAGCYTAKDAVRTCQLARELLGVHNLVKLEVLGDEKTLYPNIVETLSAELCAQLNKVVAQHKKITTQIDELTSHQDAKIGRASCRERV